MANVLTNLIPNLYQGLDVVSRELVGFIPSVARNSGAERAAVGESVIVPVSNAMQSVDVAPAMNVPEPADFTYDTTSIVINKSKAVPFGLTGEEYKGLNNGMGANYFIGENFKQALRTLTNEIESDIAAEVAKSGARAFGSAGTTGFASDLGDAANIRKILDDNGAPVSGRSLVIDTTAGVNMRKLTQLTDADKAGSVMTLRQGELLDLFGMSIKESAQVKSFTASTAAGVTLNVAEVGATELTMKAGTSGSLKAGDIITIAGDTNKYVVAEDVTVAASAKLHIAAPGLRVACTDGAAVTVVATSVRNAAFVDSAVQLVTRAPALAGGADAAVDSYMLTDPRSGLSFEVRVYQGYRKMRAEVACAWGVKVIKPEHVALLLG